MAEVRRQYGEYRVVREIGRGGMGVVYEVEDGPQGDKLALKVLPPSPGRDAKVIRRFVREGRVVQRLRHPNIVAIHEVGNSGDDYFLVMDRIDGPTLQDIIFRLRRRRGEDLVGFLEAVGGPAVDADSLESRAYVHAVVRLLAEVAEAVHHAHEQGLIHRDIKPSNLLLSPAGRLMLTDFGLVRDVGRDTFTETGEVLGTPLYMSPEQVSPRKGTLDARTDVYALGATLYEALTLDVPHRADDLPSLVRKIERHPVAPASHGNPGVTRALETVIHKALSKRADDRYVTASALAEDLRRVLTGEKVKARRPGLVAWS